MTGDKESRWDGRRRAREAALQMLYQVEIGQISIADATRLQGTVGDAPAVELDDATRAYANALARGALAAREQLDELIGEAAKNWRIERMAVLDRIVLRLGVQEMLAHPETPPLVAIDEAIELARHYSGEEAAKFVNGVLDGIYRKLRDERRVVE